MKPSNASLLAALTVLPLTACLASESTAPEPDPDPAVATDELAAAGITCPVSGTDINRSLVVTTPAILQRFSFTRVMDRLRATASIGPETDKALFQNWMKTFGPTDCTNPAVDPNKYGLVCPRTSELKLSTIDPFTAASNVAYHPVGLFNRFDLAPANGAHCGEYRIVFAMQSTNPAIIGRSFLIFEAALPNPTPAAGKAACLPVARFWQDLTADASDASRAAKLEKFYFTGGAVAGFPAVVDAHHYGLANGATAAFTAGQVRTNMFIDFNQWHLREFKLRRTCTTPTNPATCQLRFDHVTVKANPAEELFAGTHARSAAFLAAFPATVASLAAPTVPAIGLSVADTFNEFESISQAFNVEYRLVADAAIKTAIQTRLTALHSTLTPTNILDRATTQTCAGCHQVSNGAALGGGLVWPSSNGFVQIDETSHLSPALTTKFLPARKAVLETFINAHCTPGTATLAGADADSNLTIGGSIVGAPN
jgi:hypothetical protein